MTNDPELHLPRKFISGMIEPYLGSRGCLANLLGKIEFAINCWR